MKRLGILLALASAVLWAANKLALRRGGESFNIGAGYLLSMMVTAFLNVLYALVTRPGAGPAEGWWLPLAYFIGGGITTTLLGRWLLLGSLFSLGPSRAGAWGNVAPVYTLLIAWLALGERPAPLAIAGLLATLSGVLMLVREATGDPRITHTSPAHAARVHAAPAIHPVWKPALPGLVMAVGSGVSFACGTVLRKAGVNLWPDPTLGNAIGGVAALLCWLPVSWRTGEHRTLLAVWGKPGIGYFAAAGVFASVGQLLVFLALARTSAAIVQAVMAVDTLFTLLFTGWLLRGRERRSPALVGAILLVTLGLVLISF